MPLNQDRGDLIRNAIAMECTSRAWVRWPGCSRPGRNPIGEGESPASDIRSQNDQIYNVHGHAASIQTVFCRVSFVAPYLHHARHPILVLQRRVIPHRILRRPVGRIEGCGLAHCTLRYAVPCRCGTTPPLLRMLGRTISIDSAL